MAVGNYTGDGGLTSSLVALVIALIPLAIILWVLGWMGGTWRRPRRVKVRLDSLRVVRINLMAARRSLQMEEDEDHNITTYPDVKGSVESLEEALRVLEDDVLEGVS